MKKRILLLLAAVLCVSLCACGGSESTSGDNTNNDTNTSADIKTEENDKEVVISKEELETYLEYVELTTENWSDYIEVKDKEYVTKDAFGEEIERHTSTVLSLKDGCYISEDNAIRLTYTRTFENGSSAEMTEDFSFSTSIGRDEPFHLDLNYDVTCEKIKGTIIVLNVPNEKWNINEEGLKYLRCEGQSISANVVSLDYALSEIYE